MAVPAKKPNAASKFNNAAGPKKPPARRASRFAGVNSGGDQDPMLEVSTTPQRVKFTHSEESQITGRDPYFKAKVVIVESDVDEEGAERSVIQCTSSAAISAAAPRIKAMVMAALGFAEKDDESYDAFDPDAEFIELVMGNIDSYTAPETSPADVVPPGTEFGPNPLEGLECYATVSRGGPVKDKATKQPTGDYYRNIKWSAVEV